MKARIFFLLLLLTPITSCISSSNKPNDSDLAGEYYKVRKGDTLSEIASRFRVHIREIMDVNGIDDVRSLRPGQYLYLPNTDTIGLKIFHHNETQKKSPKKSFAKKKHQEKRNAFLQFPVPKGKIFKKYSNNKMNPYDGVGIKAPLNSSVVSALDGEVIFVGDDGTKFGLLIILEHESPYITVYTHLKNAFVRKGQKVKSGKVIGSVGRSGGLKEPQLHFQFRIDQKTVNPEPYLKAHR